LTIINTSLAETLGGLAAIRSRLSTAVVVIPIAGGVLLRAGDTPTVGDMNLGGGDLGAVKEVARLTRNIRIGKRVLFYGAEEFRHNWVNRFDD
jgi:hypothetical protein